MTADCRLTVTVRPAGDAAEVEAARELRIAVFCDEQGVPRELEFDGKDEQATQMVALDESGIVATCRLRYPEAEETRDTQGMSGVAKLERMVVDRRLRGRGVGAKLLAGSEEEARRAGAATMVLNAQLTARDFYTSNGYAPEGEIFMDADIEHVRMTKAL